MEPEPGGASRPDTADPEPADPRTERTLGALRIVIDRDLCVGFGDCMAEAPDAFDLDDEGVAVFKEPERASRSRLLDACACCPVDAITVYQDGVAIIP